MRVPRKEEKTAARRIGEAAERASRWLWFKRDEEGSRLGAHQLEGGTQAHELLKSDLNFHLSYSVHEWAPVDSMRVHFSLCTVIE